MHGKGKLIYSETHYFEGNFQKNQKLNGLEVFVGNHLSPITQIFLKTAVLTTETTRMGNITGQESGLVVTTRSTKATGRMGKETAKARKCTLTAAAILEVLLTIREMGKAR